MVEKQKTEFTPFSELKQIETLLALLESKLHSFYQILSKTDRRRGLLNLGGSVMKTVFVAFTVHDVNSLHEALDELQLSQKDIVHSMSEQVTTLRNEIP